MQKQDKIFLEYALKSYEISIDLAPYEYFTPKALLQMGIILNSLGSRIDAEKRFKQALEIFTSLDQVENMKQCEEYITNLQLSK